MPRPAPLCLLVLILLTVPVPHARAAPPPGGVPAGYTVVEVSYLLRGPGGELVRVTRRPPAAPGAWALPGAPDAVQPVLGWPDWLFGAPRLFDQVSDYLRESWAALVRMRDLLGMVVLIAGSWVMWFLARPLLLGLTERGAFLLVFAVASALWVYVTQLYASVAYALGLMLLPAAVLSALAWGLRRLWRALRAAPAGAGPS